jgi:hypothetical protein
VKSAHVIVGGYASRRTAMLAEYSDKSRLIPAVLASRGGGKMASAGCRCKCGVGAVAVEVRILCRSASTALVAGVGNGM